MRTSYQTSTLSSLFLLLPCFANAVTIDCKHIKVDDVKFDFSPLGGPHSVSTIKERPPKIRNTTFTIDVCQRLEKTKGVRKEEDCQNGSRVCAITRLTDKIEDIDNKIEDTIEIAGEFTTSTGGALDPKFTRLKSSSSNADREKDGLRLEMHGGKNKDDGKKQKAIVEFICKADKGDDDDDRRRSTVNAAKDDDDEDEGDDKDDGRDDGKDHDKSGEVTDDGTGGKIKYVSWEDEGKFKVLRLEWDTKYACEGAKAGGKPSSGHWGFFTWFIIVVFLGIAAYLIFGSWLNYNRYSARGWDLLPHSDTIRDVPYLLKDFIRRVMDTFQGTHTRHGYSAV